MCDGYLATDISSEMIDIARSHCPYLNYEQHDAENLDIGSNSKDCIICLEAFIHYPNPQKAINEFYRVLKQGGILVIDSDNKHSLRRLVKKAFQVMEGNKYQFGRNIFTPYSQSEFTEMIAAPGFSIEKLKYLGTISPITVRTKNKERLTLLSPKICERIHRLGIDEVPYINRFATYHLVLARK